MRIGAIMPDIFLCIYGVFLRQYFWIYQVGFYDMLFLLAVCPIGYF